MLLSLLGVPREHKDRHRGAEMALGVERLQGKPTDVRKLRGGDELEAARADYQDLLMDQTLCVWLRPGTVSDNPSLSQQGPNALHDKFATISRFGGLSLGESSYLVDSIK